MPENAHIVANVEDLKEQIRRLSAEQAYAFGDAIYIGMTAELARECDERRRKIHNLVEILMERYEQPGSGLPKLPRTARYGNAR